MLKKLFAFMIVPIVCLAMVGCFVEAGIEDPIYDDHVVVVDDRPTVVVGNSDYVVVTEPPADEVIVEGDYVYGGDDEPVDAGVIDCYDDYDPAYCD
ncbi:MAG: hypothetical protein KC609_20790 [Myxococcales bacterium]|nr:hypothetical protein [Myxococcales bacterium]